jgi:hypothetical protein
MLMYNRILYDLLVRMRINRLAAGNSSIAHSRSNISQKVQKNERGQDGHVAPNERSLGSDLPHLSGPV